MEYWFNRDNLSYEDLLEVVMEIARNEDEIFRINGITNDMGRVIVERDDLNVFLERLFHRKKIIK